MKNRGVWIVLLFGAAFAAIMYTSTRGLSAHKVEICMEYEGREACGIASAETKEKARETATVNACGKISSGVTDSMRCQSSQPRKVEWK